MHFLHAKMSIFIFIIYSRVITSHVKDANLWVDSLNILKLVVSNSSHIQHIDDPGDGRTSSELVQPIGSVGSLIAIAPKLPWGNNLSLGDNALALTSHMFKKELPGRTIEFTYNVEDTPLIGARYNSLDKDKKPGNQSVSQAPCWRKPHGSQRRTRERLVNLLPLCGHKGGVKQTLMVDFSSPGEINDVGQHSTDDAEEDDDNSVMTSEKHDEEFSVQKLFHHFDFLDDELDRDMEVSSFHCWTSTGEVNAELSDHISPRGGSDSDHVMSANEGRGEEGTGDEEEGYGDEEEEGETSNLENSLREEEEEGVEEGDDEQEDEDEDEDRDPVVKPVSLQLSSVVEISEINETSGVGSSLSEEVSTPDTDTVPSHTSSTTSSSNNSSTAITTTTSSSTELHTLERNHHAGYVVLNYDEVPDHWSRQISPFFRQPTLDEAIDSLPCFPLVLKHWSVWLLRLLHEAGQLLQVPVLAGICTHFTHVQDRLTNQLNLPYIFIGQDILTSPQNLLKHKLTVLKLNVGLQGLQEQREQVRDQLDLLQATKHEFASSSDDQMGRALFHAGADQLNYDERGIMDLCEYLYRILMQYVMCLELYLNYVERITRTVHTTSKVTDVSADLLTIRTELIASQNSNDENTTAPDESTTSDSLGSFRETAERVSNAVATGHFHDAILVLRAYRQRHSADKESFNAEEEVENILSIYGSSMLKSRSSVYALLGSYEQLSFTCETLSENLADLLSAVYDIKRRVRSEDEGQNELSQLTTEGS